MALPALPRRALLGALLGFLYAITILPNWFLGVDASVAATLGFAVSVFGVVWLLLAFGLLLLRPLFYHIYCAWAILWVVYRGMNLYPAPLALVSDAALPLASLVLLMTSGYLPAAEAQRAVDA